MNSNSNPLAGIAPPELETRTVVERSRALCDKHGITLYRLAHILRTDEGSVKQKTTGSRSMKWILTLAEAFGLEMFLQAENVWGVYTLRRYSSRKPRRGVRAAKAGQSMDTGENVPPAGGGGL